MEPPADDEVEPDEVTDDEVSDERRRSRRSVFVIVAVVGAAVAVVAGLAVWVAAVGYDVDAPLAGRPVACATAAGDLPAATTGAEVTAWEAACDRATDDARASRRGTAVLLGAAAFVIATAVSTWPSRRLTGDRLGPLR